MPLMWAIAISVLTLGPIETGPEKQLTPKLEKSPIRFGTRGVPRSDKKYAIEIEWSAETRVPPLQEGGFEAIRQHSSIALRDGESFYFRGVGSVSATETERVSRNLGFEIKVRKLGGNNVSLDFSLEDKWQVRAKGKSVRRRALQLESSKTVPLGKEVKLHLGSDKNTDTDYYVLVTVQESKDRD